MARAGGVYDRERGRSRRKTDPEKPDLGPGHNAPSGNASDPRGPGPDKVDQHGFQQDQGLDRSRLREAESNGLYKNDDSVEEDLEGLNQAEAEADEGYASGFEPQRGSRAQRVKGYASRNKSKLGLGGGIFGGGIASIFIALFSLIPLKVEHIVTNLQDRFSHPVTSAVQGANDRIFEHYLERYVLPAYKGCGTTVSKKCHVRIVNGRSNPVRKLYQGWANTRLESKLWDRGIKLTYHSGSDTWFLETPSTKKGGVDIGSHGQRFGSATNSKEINREIRDALKLETKWEKVMYRFKIGRLLAQKYGIQRCIFACDLRKKYIKDPIAKKKLAAKMILAERVLKPRSELTYLAVMCVLDVNCHPETTQASSCTEGVDCESRGAPESEYETQQREKLRALAATFSITDETQLRRLETIFTELSDRGFQKYLIDAVLLKVFGTTVNGRVADSIPILGWINIASEVVTGTDEASGKIKKLSYLTNAAAAVAAYQTYRTFADEVHTANVDPVEVGSMVDSLGTGKDSPDDPIVGGTATAEGAPLYDDLMNGGATARSSVASSLISAFMPGKAYAASASVNPSANYKCNNGKAGILGKACPEELLGQGNGAANAIHTFLHETPGFSQLVTISKVWRDTIGVVFDFASATAGDAISALIKPLIATLDAGCGLSVGGVHPADALIGGYCHAKDLVETYAPVLIEGLANWLIPNPWSSNMGGGRLFTQLAAGASVMGKEACDQIGCKVVTGAVATKIIEEQQAEERDSFVHQSFTARMFDTESPYSLVSKVAMVTPTNLMGATETGFASILSNPISVFSTGLSSVFAGHASAATTPDPDPFKIGTTAFPSNEIPDDPEAYWDDAANGCQDGSAVDRWQQEAADGPTDPNTGMPQHSDVEPCLLIEEATGVSGAVSDSSNLTADDLGQLNPPDAADAAGGGVTGGSGTLPSGSAKDLATAILPFIESGQLVCGSAAGGSGPANCLDIQNTAKGQPIGGNCSVNALDPHLLGLILGLLKDDDWKLGISSMCSNHHVEADGPYGGHSHGTVADFSIENGAVNAAAASNKKFVDDVAALLSGVGGSFGQVGNCHPAYASQQNSKFTLFTDGCSHQHVRAAP